MTNKKQKQEARGKLRNFCFVRGLFNKVIARSEVTKQSHKIKGLPRALRSLAMTKRAFWTIPIYMFRYNGEGL